MATVTVDAPNTSITIVFTPAEFSLLVSSPGDLQNMINGYLS